MSIEAPLGRSDHSVITFKLYCDKEITSSNFTKYLYNKGDYAKMLQEMNSIDWVQLFGRDLKDDVESQWEFFKNTYLDVVTKHVPTRTSSIRRADKKIANTIKQFYQQLEGNTGCGSDTLKPEMGINTLLTFEPGINTKVSLSAINASLVNT